MDHDRGREPLETVFNPGDEVRLLDTDGEVPCGSVGHVIGRYADDESLAVHFDEATLVRLPGSALELVATQAAIVRLSSSRG